MGTAGPAAGAAFTARELVQHYVHSAFACLVLLGILDPAYPFIACEWGQALPPF